MLFLYASSCHSTMFCYTAVTMAKILVDKKILSLITKHGVSKTAKQLGCRYATVQAAAKAAGLIIKRGRPADPKIAIRNQKIRANRKKSKKFLYELGEPYKIGRERVRQILKETGGDPLK